MSLSVAAPRKIAATRPATGTLVAFAAMLLGSVLVYGVGFASPATIHNAAHDARHAFSFPCH